MIDPKVPERSRDRSLFITWHGMKLVTLTLFALMVVLAQVCPFFEADLKPLQLTSVCFVTIVIHAYHKKLTDIFYLSLMVCIFSLWYHTGHNKTVKIFDMFFATLYWAYTATELFDKRSWIVIFSFAIAIQYLVLFTASGAEKEAWHVSMHFFVLIGSHLYIFAT